MEHVSRIIAPAGDDRYRAGACNIGPEEIASRRRIGLGMLAAAVVLAVTLIIIDAPAWTRLLVFPVVAAAFITLEQARRRFCVAFGFAGVRNFGPLGRAERIDSDIDRATDRRTATVMVLYASAIAALVTLVFVFLPV
jgi:hypothetical protein